MRTKREREGERPREKEANPCHRKNLHDVGEDDTELVIGQQVAFLELLHVNIPQHSQVSDMRLLRGDQGMNGFLAG